MCVEYIIYWYGSKNSPTKTLLCKFEKLLAYKILQNISSKLVGARKEMKIDGLSFLFILKYATELYSGGTKRQLQFAC